MDLTIPRSGLFCLNLGREGIEAAKNHGIMGHRDCDSRSLLLKVTEYLLKGGAPEVQIAKTVAWGRPVQSYHS